MLNDIRILQGAQALHELEKRRLLPRGEFLALAENLRGGEGLAIAESVTRAWQAFLDTLKTCEILEGKADDPTVHLHYFIGSWDWYVTRTDSEPRQHRAFGFVKSELCPEGEWGCINLEEVTQAGAELDLYFTPAPVSTFTA